MCFRDNLIYVVPSRPLSRQLNVQQCYCIVNGINSRITYRNRMRAEGKVERRRSLQNRDGGQEYMYAGPSIQLGSCGCKTSQFTTGKLYVVKDFNVSTHFVVLSTLALTASKYAIVGVWTYTANNQLDRPWPLSSIVYVLVPGIALSEMSTKLSSVVCQAMRKITTG